MNYYYWNLHCVAKFALASAWHYYGREGIESDVRGPIAHNEDEETQEQLIKAYVRTMKYEAEIETLNLDKN